MVFLFGSNREFNGSPGNSNKVRKTLSCPTITFTEPIDINGNSHTIKLSSSKSLENVTEVEELSEGEADSQSTNSSPTPEDTVVNHMWNNCENAKIVHGRSKSDTCDMPLPIIVEEQLGSHYRDTQSQETELIDESGEEKSPRKVEFKVAEPVLVMHDSLPSVQLNSREEKSISSESSDDESSVTRRLGADNKRRIREGRCQSTVDTQIDSDDDNDRLHRDLLHKTMPAALLRTHSVSTPSIDRVGVNIKSPSSIPTWSLMSPRASPGLMVLPSKKALRSQSVIAKPQTPKPSRTNSDKGNWLFWKVPKRNNSNKDKVRQSHTFISASCSNSGRCEVCNKSLARSPSAQAYQCDKCDIFVHVQCCGHVGSCSKWAKHHHQRPKSMLPPTPSSVDRVQRKLPHRFHSPQGSPDNTGDDISLGPSTPLDDFPQLNLVEYADVDLWSEDAEPWSVTHRQLVEKLNHLDKKEKEHEIKRQDVIHELLLTEKHHCQTLLIMKEIYWRGLNQFMREEELNKVIPIATVDSLLNFHISFLRSLRQRIAKNVLVSGIDDILKTHFVQEDDQHVKSYIRFAYMKDTANAFCKELCLKNQKFQQYITEVGQRSALLREHSLTDCLLLVTQRVTKYSVLVESIRKHSRGDELTAMIDAEQVIKQFIMSIDDGLRQQELSQHWHNISAAFDPSSKAQFHSHTFTSRDLLTSRQLLHFGEVRWGSAQRKLVDVHLLLFDDLIAFVRRKSDGKYCFYSQDNHEAVIELAHHVLVRENAVKNSFFIIVTRDKPDMYDIVCSSKKSKATWIDAIQKAINRKPQQVRLLTSNGSNLACVAELAELRNIMSARAAEDNKHLDELCTSYRNWLNQASTKLLNLPLRSNEKIRSMAVALVEEEFTKLKEQRRTIVDSFAVEAQAILSETLKALANSGGPESACKPKRNETFHSTDRPNKSIAIRRHTTVPKFKDNDLANAMTKLSAHSSADSLQCSVDMESFSASGQEVMLQVLKEMHSLKVNNEKLNRQLLVTADIDQSESSADNQGALENLRETQKKLDAKKLADEKALEDKQSKLEHSSNKKQKELDERENILNRRRVELDERENQMQAKLNHLQKTMDICQARGLNLSLSDSPNGANISPVTPLPVFSPAPPEHLMSVQNEQAMAVSMGIPRPHVPPQKSHSASHISLLSQIYRTPSVSKKKCTDPQSQKLPIHLAEPKKGKGKK